MFTSVPNTMPNPFTGADFPASYNGGVNDPNSMIDIGNQHYYYKAANANYSYANPLSGSLAT